MSDAPADRFRLDIDEQIARIEKTIDEGTKLRAEARKLDSERRKFNRDWWIVPLTVFGAILAAIVARLPEILAAFGVKP
jgi:hypothetical protein